MKNAPFILDDQLEADTHYLFSHASFYILLHKNASIPWIILVPKTDVVEIYDLPNTMQSTLFKTTKVIATYFEDQFNIEKMNIAAIGNIVKQLHIHVIGRKECDACWPGVVWGCNYPSESYTKKQIDKITDDLSKNHLLN